MQNKAKDVFKSSLRSLLHGLPCCCLSLYTVLHCFPFFENKRKHPQLRKIKLLCTKPDKLSAPPIFPPKLILPPKRNFSIFWEPPRPTDSRPGLRSPTHHPGRATVCAPQGSGSRRSRRGTDPSPAQKLNFSSLAATALQTVPASRLGGSVSRLYLATEREMEYLSQGRGANEKSPWPGGIV